MTPTYRSTTGVRPVLASPAMRRRLRAVALLAFLLVPAIPATPARANEG